MFKYIHKTKSPTIITQTKYEMHAEIVQATVSGTLKRCILVLIRNGWWRGLPKKIHTKYNIKT